MRRQEPPVICRGLCDSYKLSRTELPTAACDDAVTCYLSCRQGFAAGAVKLTGGGSWAQDPSAGSRLATDIQLKN
jgi:hypothetical protein